MMIPNTIKIKNQFLPDSTGVYVMKDVSGAVLYVGKAVSIKRRVTSHFARPADARMEEMIRQIQRIDYFLRPTAIEALILEANLIKHFLPKYNILQKDKKSFLYLGITREDFPRPQLIRGNDLEENSRSRYRSLYGPYISGRSLRAALDLLRSIFPWSSCTPGQPRPCFNVHLGLCPGVCAGLIRSVEYRKIMRDLEAFFSGKKEQIIHRYRRDMRRAAADRQFERAAVIRNKVYALEHMQDVAVLKREDASQNRNNDRIFGRVEGYDISNISGTSSVASMVVCEEGAVAKSEYRRFRIKTVQGTHDVASITEVLARRVRHHDWRKPNLILIDGGRAQVQAACVVLQKAGWTVPVVGMAKGPKRKRNDLVFGFDDPDLQALCIEHRLILENIRDEAHRFAISYHKHLRSRTSLQMF